MTLSLLLDVPAIQNFAVQRAVRALSRKLETTVSIGRVDIGIFSKVQLENLYVEDYQRDTLLYVGRLDAFVTGLGLFGGGVSLSRGEIVGARLCLRETPQGEMNIKQIVNRLSDPDKPRKGNFRLSLRKASIEGMELCLERIEKRNPEFGIDFSHLCLHDLTARIDDFTIDGQTIHTSIAAMSARERSGFALDRLAGRFYLTNGCLGFSDVEIITERSNVSFPYISLVGNSWADYKDFIGQVRLDGALRNTTLSTDDVAYFAPRLRDWHLTLSNVNLTVSGEVADFTGRIASMRIGDEMTLEAAVEARGLPDFASTRFDATILGLHASAAGVESTVRSVTGRGLPPALQGMLANAGTMNLKARFEGLPSSFDVKLNLASEAGTVDGKLRMRPLKTGDRSIRGDVSTRNFRLGRLTGRRDLLGNASFTGRIDGTVGSLHNDAAVTGELTRLELNDYAYDSLRLDGRLLGRGFDGRITARDPNLDFDFAGSVDFGDSIPRYDFTLDLKHADLRRLNINRRDTLSQLSGRIVANAGGRSLDDLNGSIQVQDARYRYNDKQIESLSLTITGENSATSKYVSLRSDFADATFRSKTGYRVIVDYLRRSAWKYLPLPGREQPAPSPAARRSAVADDFSLLSLQIRNINPIADAITQGLQVADGSSMQLLFNPVSNQLSLKLSSDYVERGRMLATRLSVNASNRGDSLTLYASAEDLYAGALHLPRLSVQGGARQGSVQLTTGFDDTLRRLSGLVGLRADVAEEEGPDGRAVDISILPSHLTRRDKTWQIFARKIRIDTARILIDRFYVRNSDQELLVDGIASRNRDDSLTLGLRNFDLAPLAQIADRMGYSVEGRTNGSATMKSAMRGGEIRADILFDSLEVNDIAAPPLRLTSRWDFARNRASVTVADRAKGDTVVRGFFDPARMRYYARLKVDSLDMGLLDPVLSGVISSTRGSAAADLVLQGHHRDADLQGEIRVKGFSTKVDFTQVTYTMPEAVMKVDNNLFRAARVPIYDQEGNGGLLDLSLNLKHLSNIAYDVRVSPQRMMVLHTDEEDNDFFYGKVYATGTARISGDKAGVEMDIAAATDDNSSFYMPLSDKANISYADFVVFEKPPVADTLDSVTRKKLSFERKRRQKVSSGGDMNIALALDVRPNVEVELMVAGSAIRARGEGTLNMQINPKTNQFEMYGDYTIDEGSYNFSLQNVINKRFVIENGSTIQWTGSPMDARLDIDAVYKLKASLQPLLQGTSDNLAADRSVPVECVIRLGERLTDPQITFDVRVPGADPETQAVVASALSTPEAIDTQFLYLLIFNSFMTENNIANANLGASMGVGTGLEFLSGLLNNWIGDYGLVIRYRPKSELAGDEVDVGLSRSLINNRLFVELEGNYLIDNKQSVNGSMSNFMGEAYITYLIDRAGTLRLKAFTQTIDRFDENQGLQETGIGIYYKEDFDNFRDFRKRVKERFTNKKRKARKEKTENELK